MPPETYIEIVGGMIRTMTRDVISEAPLDAALPFMENRVPVITPLLPVNPVRAMIYDESDPTKKRLELLVQSDPITRVLDYDQADPLIEARVALPYTAWYFNLTTTADKPRGQDWAMSLENIRVYWSQERITDLNQWVIPAVLPNVYIDGKICFWQTAVRADQPLSDRIDQIINDFYLTRFTNHHVRTREWPWARKTYKRWARETIANPLCWKDFPEWDRQNIDPLANTQHYQLKSLFTTPMPRDVPIVLADGIPPLQFTPTFGRAEEWARDNLDATQRFRLKVALANLEAEDPTLFVATTPAGTLDLDDDD